MSVYQTRPLTLEVQAPVLCQGLENPGPGYDIGVARNAGGTPVIPGSHLAGLLKEILKASDSDTADKWFGKSSASSDGADSNEPSRKSVIIRDLVLQDGGTNKPGSSTRVKIDDSTGAAQDGMLIIAETIADPGTKLTFSGEVDILVASKDEQQRVCEFLHAALAFLPAVGSSKTAGFGKVLDYDVGDATEKQTRPQPFEPQSLGDDGYAVYLELRIRDPFVVNAQLLGGNLFKGDVVVPGSVLKALAAEGLPKHEDKERERLSSALSEMSFAHALPVNKAKGVAGRECPLLPLSAFKVDGNDRFFDAFVDDVPMDKRITNKNSWYKDDPGTLYPEFAFHQSTRTAINAETGLSEEGQIFSHSAVVPDQKHVWVARVQWPKNIDAEARLILAALAEQGVSTLGKTKARADLSFISDAACVTATEAAPKEGDVWHLTLRTPALLHSLDCHQDLKSEPNVAQEYRQAFKDSFALWAKGQEVREDDLTLINFFAEQKWYGGYLGMRYHPHFSREQEAPSGRYFPYLLTEPRSVFALKATTETARAYLRHCLRYGVPLPFETDWKRCPFVPENGFGEVALHDPEKTSAFGEVV